VTFLENFPKSSFDHVVQGNFFKIEKWGFFVKKKSHVLPLIIKITSVSKKK